MTALLNKAIDYCDSEVDGEIAGFVVSNEDVLVAAVADLGEGPGGPGGPDPPLF